MNSQKDISIITVAYKDPLGLKATIESLVPLLHTNISWEHVIVDSSEGEHSAILTKLPKTKDSSWPLVHVPVPPTGAYPAMNHGWRRSQGPLLLFLNSGSRLKSSLTLEKAVKEFRSDPNLELLIGTAELSQGGQYLYSKAPHPSFIRNILGFNGIFQQAMLYKRSAFERVGEFSSRYKLASDYEHHFRCYLEGLKHKSMNLHLVELDITKLAVKKDEILAEFARVHKSLADRLSPPIVRLNELLLQWETTRTTVLRNVTESTVLTKLRPIWLRYQRRKSLKS